MSKRKKSKSSAAENLIETLMGDLKEIQGEASYHDGHSTPLSAVNSDVKPSDATRVGTSNNLWDQLEDGMEKNLDDSEFPGEKATFTKYNSNGEDSVYVETHEEEYEGDGISDELPAGFGEMSEVPDVPDMSNIPDVPASEQYYPAEVAQESVYKGPVANEGRYQTPSELYNAIASSDKKDDDSTSAIYSSSPAGLFEDKEDKTVSLQADMGAMAAAVGNSDGDKTIAVEGFANAKLGPRKSSSDVDVKVSIGGYRGGARAGAANVMTSVDASLAQAENLKIAQQRILDLEKEVESLRAENEELASAGEIVRSRTDDLAVRISSLEKEKQENHESAQSEMLILKGNLQYKESEVAKGRLKIDELETRLKSDFKKIRVRERELENRLELLRAEKSALVRSKDEYILDLKRKIDQLSMELDNYRKKCLELNKALDANQDQFKRTERALRLALTNLEASEDSPVPYKKAE